ncbi:MAG: 3-dehydroquinate synthase [Thermaurantimonas sp.]|uniref:3-dehydroquinate synthase n=1 Tax=Thermaurantimonas sp. TaxID=2681568 RepID=UPI00391B0626
MPRRSNFDSLILKGDEGYAYLSEKLTSGEYSELFLLMDTNTLDYCRDDFFYKLNVDLPFHEIEVEPGEQCKTIEIATHLWSELAENQADRKSLLINLGGGSVSDLGGFVASTYKRGIPYINVPTTLLSMVDAAYGGKTGIDFGGIKNLIGTFYPPQFILIDPEYTATLDERQFTSAFGEIFKYGLALDAQLWEEVKSNFPHELDTHLEDWVERCLKLKQSIVVNDPLDQGERQILNAGHTIGHAMEAFHLDKQDEIYHGEAIAWGLIAELFISYRLKNFDLNELENFKKLVLKYIQRPSLNTGDVEILLDYIYMDKKTLNSIIYMPLITAPGRYEIQQQIDPELISEGLIYMLS